MLVRRLLLLAAVLMLLAALAAGLAPRDPAGETAAAPVTSLPKGTDVEEEISATAGGGSWCTAATCCGSRPAATSSTAC
jgi:hypothetical protein